MTNAEIFTLRLIFALLGALSLDVLFFEALQITHNDAIYHHHSGAQVVASVAAFVFGGIIGWGCSR